MSAIEYRQQPIAQCLDQALAFRNANRPNERPENYLRWRYLARPCAVPAYVVWALEKGQILGAATVAPHDFSFGGRDVVLGVVGDISVAASAQGRGIGSELLESVRTQRPADVTDMIVLPNRAAEGPLKRAGWVRVGEVQRSVRPLRASGAADFAKLLLSWLTTLRADRRPLPADVALEDLSAPPPALDLLWESVRDGRSALAYRNAAYLDWRYFRHPMQRYVVSALNVDSELAGYVVWHDDSDGRWVDDFLINPNLSLSDVASTVLSAAKRDKSMRVHVRQFGKLDWTGWRSAGFMRRPDSQSVLLGRHETATMLATLSNYFTAGDKDA